MSAPAVAVSDNGNKYAAAWKDIRTGEPNVYWTISDKPESADGQLVHDETKGKQDQGLPPRWIADHRCDAGVPLAPPVPSQITLLPARSTLIELMRKGIALAEPVAQQERRPRSLGCLSIRRAGPWRHQGGQIYGTSDRDSAYPTSKPVSPEDMRATIYHAMGISPSLEMHDQLGRPHRVVDGKSLTSLF